MACIDDSATSAFIDLKTFDIRRLYNTWPQ